MPKNQLTPAGENELGAAFGYYPSMGKRRVQDPVGATEVPLQMLRGRVAATLGLPSDVLNVVRSPMPMEAFGDVDYSEQKLVPYGTSQLLKELPLAPTSRVGQVAGEIGSFAPMSPAEALQAARVARQAAMATDRAAMAVGKVGERYAERVVPQIMERGGLPAQLLTDLSQGSRRQIFRPINSGDEIGGLTVRNEIPNTSSISSELNSYETLGLQEVPMSAFQNKSKPKYYSKQEEERTKKLAEQINVNKEINPLIVIKDNEGYYVLEGGHRFDALKELDAKSFPALVVQDTESMPIGGLLKQAKPASVLPTTKKTDGIAESTNGLRESRKNAPTELPQENALKLAKERAVALGQSEIPANRMLQQGYEDDWYHGSTGDITRFREDLLGEATGAASAKKGFFFARDPQNPPASLMQKTDDPKSIELLKKLGKTDEEIAALNSVSMKGHGPETASGYAQIGGSREYREATRKAKAAERRGDWDEYEKQAQIAEDSEIKRMNYAQDLTAKYGDRRDEMLASINESIYSKKLGQAEAEALDAKVKELMPYGWYNSFDKSQMDTLKSKLVDLLGKDGASKALKNIDSFQSIKNERALIDKTQEGGNVMPVALRYKNPLVHDFGGSSYREQTYSDLIDKALAGGHDALILKNTYDPGAGASKLVDVGVVFSPDQIRSRFAAFDPLRKTAATAAAAGLAAPDLLAQDKNQLRKGR